MRDCWSTYFILAPVSTTDALRLVVGNHALAMSLAAPELITNMHITFIKHKSEANSQYKAVGSGCHYHSQHDFLRQYLYYSFGADASVGQPR